MSQENNYFSDYIGKKCTIYLSVWRSLAESVDCTIIDYKDNWLKVETKKAIELLKIDKIYSVKIKK